jgi:hypothetical protein
VAGGLAFLAPLTALRASPRPPADQAEAGRPRRPALVVRKITRIVVVHEPPSPAPVRYVVAPSSGSTSTGSVATQSSSTTSAHAAPAPPSTTTTGGS